ncbi:homocysteine S-methyltransferase family protein [Acuticoccus sediminis]|uniref:homocysteine S-methyltransferase family protein n=1 Tax=Acuticoccus sediminis TaxID=2184697 RepID=UPI001CFCCB09|nr:homocysteine S-methyltransferase family protein [Acuticoccus sediminis]
MVRLLDGGMGQELRRRAVGPTDSLIFSARALIETPHAVQSVHEDYLRAGADVITAHTYVTNRWRLRQEKLDDDWARINAIACDLADAAREAVNPGALVAGSVPPLRQAYQADFVPTATLDAEYAEHVLLLAPRVDFFLCETLSTSTEAIAAARAVASVDRRAWISFTLEEEGPPRLRGGEPLAVAVAAIAGAGPLPVDAILVNCTTPEAVGFAVAELAALELPVPYGGYANGFGPVPGDFGLTSGVSDLVERNDLDPDTYASHVARWMANGATIVGGCCQIGPPHIARLRELIDQP